MAVLTGSLVAAAADSWRAVLTDRLGAPVADSRMAVSVDTFVSVPADTLVACPAAPHRRGHPETECEAALRTQVGRGWALVATYRCMGSESAPVRYLVASGPAREATTTLWLPAMWSCPS